MKKLLTLFLILSFVFVLNGCTRTEDLEDTNIPEATVDDIYDNDINRGIDNNINDANLNNNDVIDNDLNGNNLTGMNNNDYLNSVRDIDIALRKSTADNNAIDVNDENYLPSRVTYYTDTANAYRTALNNINNVKYTTNNKAYHDAIVKYYQSGYDTYNNLATKYRGFNNIDDELTYRNTNGSVYEIKQDLRNAYEDALNRIGIDVNTDNYR